MKCPSFEELIDYLEGRLVKKEASRIKEHLAGNCSGCGTDKLWFERFATLARSDESYKPPPWLRQRAVDLFGTERAVKRAASRRSSFGAILSFDSAQQTHLADARPAEIDGRRLVYHSAGFNIDVQMTPTSTTSAELFGQILHEAETGFESVSKVFVDLTGNEQDNVSTVTNDFGEFLMKDISFGRYDLLIETRKATLTIADLPVFSAS